MRLLVPAQETLDEVAQQLSWLRIFEGGQQAPLDCQARYKIAIIVPYRDRQSNLCTFLLNMHPILTKQQLDYTIFIVEQLGKLKKYIINKSHYIITYRPTLK